MTNTSPLTYIDIFAGCGGMSLGLYKSGWKGLFAIEKDAMAFQTLKHNLIDWGREKLDVDVMFMALFEIDRHGFGQNNDYESRFRIVSSDLYLFDVRRRQMYFRKGGDRADKIKRFHRRINLKLKIINISFFVNNSVYSFS